MPRISKAEKAQVRRRLLESAAQHFAAHGLTGANINTISVDAGYARGTVYNYFPSKEALFAAVLGQGSEATVRRYRARRVVGDTRAHLLAMLEEDAALVRDHEAFSRVLVHQIVSPQPDLRDHVDAALAPLVAEVTDVLVRGQAAGDITPRHAAPVLAQVLLGQLVMAYARSWASEGAWPVWEEIPALCVDLFLNGAGAQPP